MRYFKPKLPDPKTLPCELCGKSWDEHIKVILPYADRDPGELRSCDPPPKAPSYPCFDCGATSGEFCVKGCRNINRQFGKLGRP